MIRLMTFTLTLACFSSVHAAQNVGHLRHLDKLDLAAGAWHVVGPGGPVGASVPVRDRTPPAAAARIVVLSSNGSADRIPDAQLRKIAAQAVPGGEITDVAIERKLGANRYVVEVLNADGGEVDVIIDMRTGEVLALER